jgi:DNA polymerase III sliding clamp (beta) subunit (PCNA family)
MEDVILLEKTRVPDGEGGFITRWSEGAVFKAAVTFDTSMESRIAEKQGVTSRYTVTTRKSAMLEFHDVFRRLSDGKIFRVTSDGDDKYSPNSSSLNMRQVTAEEWSI